MLDILLVLFYQFILIVNIDYYDEISISFQPPGYYLPTSWIQDIGEIHSEKNIQETHTKLTKNFTFGWNSDLTSNTWHIDIRDVTYTHKFIETGISLNPCDLLSVCDIWNIQIKNGFYFVEIGIGQPLKESDDTQILNQSFHYSSTIISESEELLSASFKPTNTTSHPTKWLHIGSKVVQVIDNNLTIQQFSGSFGTNIDYLIIKRIKCGNISTEFALPENTRISIINYSVYYPSTVPIVCDIGFKAEPVNLKCNLNGKWMWDDYEIESGSNIQCEKIDCGKIDGTLLSPYDANIYWQEYSYYNSVAIVICNSKDVSYVGELVCKETEQWKWKNGTMQFRCPSFTPINTNITASVFSQYLEWFIAAIILGGLSFIFVCLHLHSYLYNKYTQKHYRSVDVAR